MDIGKLKVDGSSQFKLGKFDPAETYGISKSHAAKSLPVHVEKLSALHDVLYAENKRALLIVLQGMDTAGKDGTIRHVMSGVNPQGCSVASFKEPTPIELRHDFLWRVHAAVPPCGTIGIFNRSHYEDVLISRVHELVPPAVWKRRYEQINDFEKMLTENRVHILKFFLHISNREQGKRFEERLADPNKNWKASAADFKERKFWDRYQEAYEDAVRKCATKEAPWHVIPSDHKWFRNFAVAEIVVQTLDSFKMSYPKAAPEIAGLARGGKSIPAGDAKRPKTA